MKTITPKVLLNDLRELIETARQDVARQVNSALVLLYWRVGKRIRQDILKEKRAGYGEQILPTLSAELMKEFGTGFTARNLANMVRFAEIFPDEKILHTLCAKLSWSHFRLIIYLDDDLKRDFYAEMCRIERWSTRTFSYFVTRQNPLLTFQGSMYNLIRKGGIDYGKGKRSKRDEFHHAQ
jgi:hypothetical protein